MKKQTLFFLILIILIYITFFFFSTNKLYYGDEVVFVIAAREIATGQVAGHFGFGEGKITEKSDMLIHPPTYIYLLALFIFLFGDTTYSIRAVSAAFAIGVIILIYLITKKILETRNIEEAETWALIASFIYAISPIAIQNSILVEIDGGLLNFFTLLFLYFYISKKSLVYLIPSLFMVFYSKMTTIPILFVSLILLNIISSDYKKIWRTIKLFLISGLSFFITFFLYAETFGLDWNRLFMHNSVLEVIKSFFSNPLLISLKSLWAFKTFFYFTTPFLTFLFIILSIAILKNIFKYKSVYINENKDIILLWLYTIMVFGLYFIVGQTTWNFSKCHIVAVPSIIILIIYFMPKKIINLKKIIPLLILTIILLSGYFIFVLGDPIIPEIKGRVITSSLFQVAKVVLIRIFLYAIVPLFLCIGLFERIPKKKVWLVLFFLLIFTSFYIDIIQAKADYSTSNLYGDKGLKEVLNFMKDKPPSEILCYHYIGYYLGYLEISELETLLYNKPELIKIIQTNNINWIIINKEDLLFIGKETFKDFEIEKQIYNYNILRRKQ
jgi:4-amino-4-deoxy-L-arabinose transferase-like glycosyltransferase